MGNIREPVFSENRPQHARPEKPIIEILSDGDDSTPRQIDVFFIYTPQKKARSDFTFRQPVGHSQNEGLRSSMAIISVEKKDVFNLESRERGAI